MPEQREPGFLDYVKAAIVHRPRVPGLGGVPLNLLTVGAFLVAGLANPGFWLIGAAYEVAYVTFQSQSKRFRALVRGQQLLAQALTFQQRLDRVVKSLSREGQARYGQLQAKVDRIRALGLQLGAGTLGNVDEMQESGLNSLLLIYARLLASRESIFGYLRDADTRAIEDKMEETRERLAQNPPEAVKRSLEASLQLLAKRAETQSTARQNLEVVEAEIDRIQNQVDLVREELAVSRDPSAFTARIDAIAGMIGEANQFLKVNESLLTDLGAGGEAPPVAMPPRSTEKA